MQARGSPLRFLKTPATEALRRILAHRPVNILPLGPLTNVATFLVNCPELRREIVRVIAVAGRRPGKRFRHIPLLPVSLGDSNFEADPSCFDLVLRSGFPITLIPYEVVAKVMLNRQDLGDLLAGLPAHCGFLNRCPAGFSYSAGAYRRTVSFRLTRSRSGM